MEKITTSDELQNAIQKLEVERSIQKKSLQIQFHLVYQSLKPVDFLKSTLKDIISSPSITKNAAGSLLGVISGYFSKRLISGKSESVVRKVLGAVAQYGVRNVVASHSGNLKTIAQTLFQHLFAKKEPAKQ
ncbi:MAG: hypothetical protein KKA07_09800 [Bacteroidetes bacterium]|nr:hypothetical protein [Bacteroidota bacterium]MBU1719354.1 hypothetical protein [Bacteroidota bacterium]